MLSLYVTVVLDPAQLPLLDRAKFICLSSFLINAFCNVLTLIGHFKRPPFITSNQFLDSYHHGNDLTPLQYHIGR